MRPILTDQQDHDAAFAGAGLCAGEAPIGVPAAAPPAALPDTRAVEWGSSSPAGHELSEIHDEFATASELVRGDCLERLSRARARYQDWDAGCEADYRTAFLLDGRFAASAIIGQLEAEIREDLVFVLMGCRKRLACDPRDLVARARLGLALLLLFQDPEAFRNLQRVFLQDASWRPFLRLLVNEAKQRRAGFLRRLLGATVPR
jgi:hypothetical protein